MKKYTKPQIMFEDFSLSTNIAACQNEASHADDLGADCKAYWDDEFGAAIFSDPTMGCTFDKNAVNDKLCYHSFDISLNLFGS